MSDASSADEQTRGLSEIVTSLMNSFTARYPHITREEVLALSLPCAFVSFLTHSTGSGSFPAECLSAAVLLVTGGQLLRLSREDMATDREELKRVRDFTAMTSLAGLEGTIVALASSKVFGTDPSISVIPGVVSAQELYGHYLARKRVDAVDVAIESLNSRQGSTPDDSV